MRRKDSLFIPDINDLVLLYHIIIRKQMHPMMKLE